MFGQLPDITLPGLLRASDLLPLLSLRRCAGRFASSDGSVLIARGGRVPTAGQRYRSRPLHPCRDHAGHQRDAAGHVAQPRPVKSSNRRCHPPARAVRTTSCRFTMACCSSRQVGTGRSGDPEIVGDSIALHAALEPADECGVMVAHVNDDINPRINDGVGAGCRPVRQPRAVIVVAWPAPLKAGLRLPPPTACGLDRGWPPDRAVVNAFDGEVG